MHDPPPPSHTHTHTHSIAIYNQLSNVDLFGFHSGSEDREAFFEGAGKEGVSKEVETLGEALPSSFKFSTTKDSQELFLNPPPRVSGSAPGQYHRKHSNSGMPM